MNIWDSAESYGVVVPEKCKGCPKILNLLTELMENTRNADGFAHMALRDDEELQDVADRSGTVFEDPTDIREEFGELFSDMQAISIEPRKRGIKNLVDNCGDDGVRTCTLGGDLSSVLVKFCEIDLADVGQQPKIVNSSLERN